MKSLFCQGGLFRKAAILSVAIFCLAGANCGNTPPSTTEPAVSLTGNSPNTLPPPDPEATMISLINSRVRPGLPALVNDPIGTSVARTHSNYMDTSGTFSPLLNGQDFATRLINAGVAPPIDVQPVLAQAFSDPNALITAILANPNAVRALQRNATRIGLALEGRGSGNFWTILTY